MAIQIVDTDLTTVLFDFDSSTGAGNPGGVRTNFGVGRSFNIGTPELEVVHFQPESSDGGTTARMREPLKAMTWAQRILGNDFATYREGVGQLGRLLKLGGVMKWQPDAAADPFYVDFEPSPAPATFGGRNLDLLSVLKYFEALEGVDLLVWRQPHLRWRSLDSVVNIMDNATLTIDVGDNGRPDDWTWVSAADITSEAIANHAYRFNIATSAERSLRQATLAGAAAPGDIFTGTFYAWQAGTDSNCQSRVRIEFIDSGTTVLATHNGTLVSLTTAAQRLSLTTPAAPASTSKVRLSLVQDNITATSFTVYWNNAQLEKAATASPFRMGSEVVSNDPAAARGWTLPFYAHGDADAMVSVRIKATDATAKVRDIMVGATASDAIVGRRHITDYLNVTKYAQCEATGGGWTVALGADTTAVAETTTASGDSKARTTHSGTPTMAKRIRITRTTKVDSLRGAWDVLCRIKATAASKHWVQLRWSPSLADPAAYSKEEIAIDKTGFTAFQYEYINLGRVYVPESTPVPLSGLAFELWSRRESGTGNLDWDYIAFVPVNERLSSIYVPGSSSEVWLGKDLVEPTNVSSAVDPGSVEGDWLLLNAATEAGATPPVAGLDWPDGQNEVTFSIRNSGLGTSTVVMKVRNVTDSSDAVSLSYTLSKSQKLTQTLQFAAVSGKFYQPQVILTSGWMWIESIVHRFAPALGQNEQAYADPQLQVHIKYDASGNILQDLAIRGAVPLRVPPGLSVLCINSTDVAQVLHTLGESINNRLLRLYTVQSPRFHG
jgi:hypothetical protein